MSNNLSEQGLVVNSWRGRHVRQSVLKPILALASVFTLVVTPLVLTSTQPASAYTIGGSFNLPDESTPGFGIYIDAPQVQNSYLNTNPTTAAQTLLEDFNTATPGIGSCPSTIVGASISGGCSVYSGPVEEDLGASTTSSEPAFGGTGSRFATANSAGTILSFPSPQKYLGLWWSAGSAGNQIDFYSDGALVSSISTANLTTLLGNATQSTVPSSSVVTAINGSTYSKSFYFGNPRGYSSANPTQTLFGTSYLPNENFTYIHAFANGGTSFDQVRFSGYGFEFDNIVSSAAIGLQPNGRLVPYSFYEARKAIRFDKNAADAIGVMPAQTSLTPANINVRGFARTGYDFYGWNTASDGTGTWYADTAEYKFETDVRLYAQWESKSGKPAIFGLGIRVDLPSHTYSRPDPAHGLAIEWQGLQPLAGDENWFLCTNPHTSPGDYFLNAFPADCVEYPYGSLAGGAGGNANFPLSQMVSGKYIAYGMWAQNASGATYAIQSAPNPVSLAIQGLTGSGALTRSAFTVSGYPTSTTASWYRCDNAFVNDQTMPSGTCTSVNSNALTYTPVLADVGKYMVYKVTASISGSNLTATKIVSGGPVVAMSRFVDLVFGDLSVNLVNSNADAQLTPIPTHPDLNQIDGAWLVCNSPANSYVSGPMNTAALQAQTNLIGAAGCAPIGAQQNATTVPVTSSYFGKYLTYFYMGAQASDNTQGLFVYRSTLVPTPVVASTPNPTQSSSPSPSSSGRPVPSPTPSATPSITASPKPVEKPATPNTNVNNKGDVSSTILKPQVEYPSGEVETIEEVVITPEPVVAPPKINVASGSTAKPLSIFAPVKNESIGATGDDSLPSVPFAVLDSPHSAKSFTKNLSQLFAILAGLTLGGVAISNANRKKNLQGIPNSADISTDPFESQMQNWGDKLRIWKYSIATALDRFSYAAVIKSAKISPFLSRMFNDGSYLRAMFGPLTVIGPVAAIAVVASASSVHGGLLENQAWTILLLVSVIAFFDAMAGLTAIIAFAVAILATGTQADAWQDLRILIGTALVVIGPVMVMTAFRTIRRTAAKKFSDWWERFADLTVGPFISGWSATIFVSALPAIAGKTLAIANHVLLAGITVAIAAFIRVLIEEFAARAYPQRLDKLSPNAIPDSSKLQKYTSLALRFAVWNLMVAGVLGNTWQLWVGSALVLIPSVVSWYQEHIPNSPTLWRILPTGIPGLAFALSVITWTTAALSNLLISSEQLAKWSFAILPMPIVLFGLLALMGREGDHEFEVKPSKRNKFVYRLGGIVMLVLTVRLAGIV